MRRNSSIGAPRWVGREPSLQTCVAWCPAWVRQLCQPLAQPERRVSEGAGVQGTHPVPVCLQGLVHALQMAGDEFISKATSWLLFPEPHASTHFLHVCRHLPLHITDEERKGLVTGPPSMRALTISAQYSVPTVLGGWRVSKVLMAGHFLKKKNLDPGFFLEGQSDMLAFAF